ncbi:hypothetical protein [Nocardioides convexus]|uniref:hypothetical protein n=1 Tax=Nocardioides convexus TaxID=2712224 RepID=UPI0024183BCC|nr:hypothetical protein [Nocardioides convexus]
MTIEKFKRENPADPAAQEPTVADMTTKAIESAQEQVGEVRQGLLPAGRGRAHRQALARQRRRADAGGDQGVRRRRQGRLRLRQGGRPHAGHRHRRPRVRRLQHHREGHVHQRRGRRAAGQHRRQEHLDADPQAPPVPRTRPARTTSSTTAAPVRRT